MFMSWGNAMKANLSGQSLVDDHLAIFSLINMHEADTKSSLNRTLGIGLCIESACTRVELLGHGCDKIS